MYIKPLSSFNPLFTWPLDTIEHIDCSTLKTLYSLDTLLLFSFSLGVSTYLIIYQMFNTPGFLPEVHVFSLGHSSPLLWYWVPSLSSRPTPKHTHTHTHTRSFSLWLLSAAHSSLNSLTSLNGLHKLRVTNATNLGVIQLVTTTCPFPFD